MMADVVLSGSDGGDGSNSQEHPVLDDGGNIKIAVSQQQQEDPKVELEVKKKRLLDELESALVVVPSNPNHNNPNLVRASSLGFEVIDETALLESIPSHNTLKNGKQSRRRAAKKSHNSHKKSMTETETDESVRNSNSSSSSSKTKTTTKYSLKEMESLRFVNVSQQRNFWKAIYASFEATVANEYDTLVAAAAPNNRSNPPLPCLPNKKPILTATTGAVPCENMDSENGSPVDPSCSHKIIGEHGRSGLEECNEDDDSEDDYASIQRPAFLVEGEPNFDSGPPEDGWEYLRRVRWEADQIPKVKVAKLDRSKLSKEQSAYMPKIPDIAKCPEHLLPLKQWEDVFLTEFSALRANLSCLEGSNAMYSGNLQSVHSSELPGNNFGESNNVTKSDVLVYNHLRIGKAISQPTNLTSENKDSTLAAEKNPGLKTSIDQTSSSCPSPPLLSAILGMDSVARVSMLLKRIRLLEPANTITRTDCMWLFALCATVDAPLDADTCAALRSLLRKCADIRAGKAELDDEVVMLNILATISGKYFGQSEN